MAFALAVHHFLEAAQKTGCPVCRIANQASEKALESFLWENVNEPDVRQGILDSYGFCPTHTRVMVARELFTSSIPLGTNILYEHLGRVTANELKTIHPHSRRNIFAPVLQWLSQWIDPAVFQRTQPVLTPKGKCPACKVAHQAASNSVHLLCEEVQRTVTAGGNADIHTAYLASDGLCLSHLRLAIETQSEHFPKAVLFLRDDAVHRLEQQSRDMKEYIRKNNWTYRDEKLTEAEDLAWRKTLGFFTGIPGETFTHKVD